MNAQKVLVTGSEGYIGQHLVELLVEAGHEVLGCDLCWYDEAFVLPRRDGYLLTCQDFGDLEEKDLLPFDAVCHLAAISNDPMGDLDPQVTLDVNKTKTIAFAEKCASSGIRRFLFSSSCSVYGEAVSDLVDEKSQLNPVSLYAETKVAVEEALGNLRSESFAPFSLRNATAFGHSPNLRLDLVINDFVATASATGNIRMLSDGTAHRPLVHCRDIAAAFLAGVEAPVEIIDGLVVNFGPKDANHRVVDMARQVQNELHGCGLDIGQGAGKDSRDYAVNFDLFALIFPDFRFRYSLASGIRALRESLESFDFSQDDLASDRFKRLLLLRKALGI